MTIQRACTAAVGALLATPHLLEAADEGGAGLFSVNLGLSIWTVVVFLTLLAVLYRFAWGPILSAMESRERRIQEALDEAARRQAEAEALLAEHRRQLAEARRQAQQILAEGREAGDELRRQLEERARQEGERMVEQARREIERERDAALDAVRKESVDLALAAASRLLRERLDGVRDREMVMEYLDALNREQAEVRA